MSNQLARPHHISSLNLLRGIAALSVCGFHFLSNVDVYSVKTIFSYGYLGLGLFFIISGFIIPYSMFQNKYEIQRFPKYLLKRSVRIEPPYIISFLLIILVTMIHMSINNWQYIHDWKQFGLHFFYLNQYFGYESYSIVYWTLAIEFQFYIIIGILFPLVVHAKKIYPIILFITSSAIIWYLNLHYNWFIFQYGYLFIAGILIFLFTVKHISLKAFILFLSIVLCLAYFKNGVDVFLLILLATVAIISIKREWKITNFFGQISYSLYLTHMEAASWFILYTRDSFSNSLTLNIAAILFAVAFAIGFYYLFERPAFQLSKKIKY